MSGPFTTITVEKYYRMQDRILVLERVALAAKALTMTESPWSAGYAEAKALVEALELAGFV